MILPFVAGADPEVMITRPDGSLISSIGLVPGTKKRPKKVSCGAIQADNVLGEFNVDPSQDTEEFIHSMRSVLGELQNIVAPNQLVVRASAEFPEKELRNPKAKIFGCDPDFDAWQMAMNVIDGSAAHKPLRSAGGHLHVGMTPETKELLEDPYGKIEVVKMLDIFLGVPSVLLDRDPTTKARRLLYGKASAHRPKAYGVEYRAMGNWWIKSPHLVDLVLDLAGRAVRLTAEGQSSAICEAVGGAQVCEVINNVQVKPAAQIIENVLSKYLPKKILGKILTQAPARKAEKQTLQAAWGI